MFKCVHYFTRIPCLGIVHPHQKSAKIAQRMAVLSNSWQLGCSGLRPPSSTRGCFQALDPWAAAKHLIFQSGCQRRRGEKKWNPENKPKKEAQQQSDWRFLGRCQLQTCTNKLTKLAQMKAGTFQWVWRKKMFWRWDTSGGFSTPLANNQANLASTAKALTRHAVLSAAMDTRRHLDAATLPTKTLSRTDPFFQHLDGSKSGQLHWLSYLPDVNGFQANPMDSWRERCCFPRSWVSGGICSNNCWFVWLFLATCWLKLSHPQTECVKLLRYGRKGVDWLIAICLEILSAYPQVGIEAAAACEFMWIQATKLRIEHHDSWYIIYMMHHETWYKLIQPTAVEQCWVAKAAVPICSTAENLQAFPTPTPASNLPHFRRHPLIASQERRRVAKRMHFKCQP